MTEDDNEHPGPWGTSRMSLFRNKHRPRTCLEFRVGKSHLVEVLLHLRRADWDWYSRNEQEISDELLELMERSVIPRMFGEEIEQYHVKSKPNLFPPEKSTIGSKNKKNNRMRINNSKNQASKNGNQKNSRKGSSSKSQKPAQQIVTDEEKKPEKDVYFAFGEILQIAYRRQPVTLSHGKTIFFKEDIAGGYCDLQKLPYRLLIWCSKIVDPDNKTNPDLAGVGFYQPEMIPIASLFREPKDDLEDDDDNA